MPKILGNLQDADQQLVQQLLTRFDGLSVQRSAPARSQTPFPQSQDLERHMVDGMAELGFQHHVRLDHPRTGQAFEYDFWSPTQQVAVEIMGYRADDEIYKDLLKFHVHPDTRIGIVWVPRWKWVSGKRQDRNFTETMKALVFADTYLQVEGLVAIAYDWVEHDQRNSWSLSFNG